jgi:hypothetical protein
VAAKVSGCRSDHAVRERGWSDHSLLVVDLALEDTPMTFKPAIWRPIAIGLSAINLVAVGAAAAGAEAWHAGIHATVALALGLWAQRLGSGPKPAAAVDDSARLDQLEADLGAVRAELAEAQERIDFAERVLAQEAEQRRVGPEH